MRPPFGSSKWAYLWPRPVKSKKFEKKISTVLVDEVPTFGASKWA